MMSTQVVEVQEMEALPTPPALRARQAAQYVGLSEHSLAMMRVRGTGPRFMKRGRLVYYPISALDSWMTSA
ncbi:helix-turn-helix transcriptional regulator [Mycobacteroides abscessus]|uniref:helix-turn-helix transcriptional regulator n=1 Tax=Mycobacteroides abscessus TaxID=36809 RepID=UPI001F191F7C|nr:helix-turn-helix domain-containing protein [Mycobacteroides abscessus]